MRPVYLMASTPHVTLVEPAGRTTLRFADGAGALLFRGAMRQALWNKGSSEWRDAPHAPLDGLHAAKPDEG